MAAVGWFVSEERLQEGQEEGQEKALPLHSEPRDYNLLYDLSALREELFAQQVTEEGAQPSALWIFVYSLLEIKTVLLVFTAFEMRQRRNK